MHILTSILNLAIHLCDTVPSTLSKGQISIVSAKLHSKKRYTFERDLEIITIWKNLKEIFKSEILASKYAAMIPRGSITFWSL